MQGVLPGRAGSGDRLLRTWRMGNSACGYLECTGPSASPWAVGYGAWGSRNGGRQGWAEVRTGKGGRGREFTENGADPESRPVGSDGAPSGSSSFPTGSAHKPEAAHLGRPFQTGRNRSRNLPPAGSWLMRSGFASGYIMFLEETGSCPIRHRRGGRTWGQAV